MAAQRLHSARFATHGGAVAWLTAGEAAPARIGVAKGQRRHERARRTQCARKRGEKRAE